MKRPQLWLIAGPNGAGKSTLYSRRIGARVPMVNPDEIAKSLPGSQLGNNREAGRLALEARMAHLRAGRSFAVETTLTGVSPMALLTQARQRGYKVNLIYVGINSAQLAQGRVNARVLAGGHSVPAVDIARRYGRSLANLGVAFGQVDRIWVIDNTDTRRRLVLSRHNGKLAYLSRQIPEWVARALPIEQLQRERSATLARKLTP